MLSNISIYTSHILAVKSKLRNSQEFPYLRRKNLIGIKSLKGRWEQYYLTLGLESFCQIALLFKLNGDQNTKVNGCSIQMKISIKLRISYWGRIYLDRRTAQEMYIY